MTDDQRTTVSRIERLDRRKLVGMSAALGLGGVSMIGLARAQGQAEATPDATGTPAATGGDATTVDLSDGIATIQMRMDSLEEDIVATAGSIETAEIDALIAQASTHLSTASGASDESGFVQLLAADHALRAAWSLLRTRLGYAGLPSEEAATSRLLAAAHERIVTQGEDVAGSTDADTGFYVSTGQSLYGTAYDLYVGGAFNQASGTAQAAIKVIAVVAILNGDVPSAGWPDGSRQGTGGIRGGPFPDHILDDRSGYDRTRGLFGPDGSPDDAPVDVPEPSF